ncbi:hypothetical protein [Natronospora cellulosivora (SeqCode)]
MGQEEGELRNDIPIFTMIDFFEFSFIEAIKPVYINPEDYNANESINCCIDLFMNGAKSGF